MSQPEFSIKEQIQLPATYSVSESSEEARNALALSAAKLEAVTSPVEQQSAVEIVRQIKAHIVAVAEARTSLTRPMDSAKALLIQLQRDHCLPLVEEATRLERHLTAFDQAEKARVAAADEMRRNEIARKAAELDKAIATARDLEAAATNEAELDRALTAEVTAHEAKSALYRSIAAPLPTQARVAGVFTKPTMKWEVTDIHALYAARPDLCRVEPNAAAIKESCVPEMPVPGLKCWWIERTTVRR